MKKITALLLSALMIVTAAGCSGGGNKEAAEGKTSIKIGVPNGDTLTPLSLIDEYKAANPDVSVELDEAPWNDFKSKLKMQIAGGNAPDVFIMDSGYTATLGGLGAAMDLSEKIASDLNAEDYIGALFAAKDADGHVWGVPHGLNSIALYYNEQLFDDAGLEYPTEDWTFEDMIEAAKKLTTPVNATGVSDVYGLCISYSITNGWLPFVLSTGGAPLTEDLKGSNFLAPETVEGVKKFEEVVKSGITPPLPWLTTKGSMEAAFYTGSVAMAVMQSAYCKVINENAPEGFRYNVVSMPYGYNGEKHSVYVPNAWVINAKSDADKQEAAWNWVKHYLSEESQLLLAEETPGGYPIHKKAIEFCDNAEFTPSNRSVFYKYIDECGVTLFENPKWEEWKPEVDLVFRDLYNGVISSDEAVKQMDDKVSEILAE